MPSGHVTDEIVIDDFTPGIHEDTFSTTNTQAAPDGAAVRDSTFSCYGGPRGGLHPLPYLDLDNPSMTEDILDFEADILDFPPFADLQGIIQIAGSGLMSPVTHRAVDTGSQSDVPDQMFICYLWWADNDGDGEYTSKSRIRTYKLFLDDSTYDYDHTGVETALNDFRIDSNYYGTAMFDTTRTSGPGLGSSLPGYPVMVAMYVSHGWNNDESLVTAFPNPNTLTTDSWFDIIDISAGKGNNVGNMMVCHQGRIIFIDTSQWDADRFGYGFGSNGRVVAGEAFQWTEPNQFTDLDDLTEQGALFVEENPTGYGSWCSMNSNELFLVKHRGGAVVVRGNIANPSVVRYPGVPSTYGATNKGVMTDKGYIYGTRHGIWLWSGGDTAEHLSPQMDGFFWELPFPTQGNFVSPITLQGQFAYSFPFVYVTNNWILDVRTGGWFRLGRPSDQGLTWDRDNPNLNYHSYHVAYDGKIYAVPQYFTYTVGSYGDNIEAIIHNTVWHKYDPARLAPYYEWRSQPLARTRNRILKFRRVTITVQGHGQVIVRLSGAEGDSAIAQFLNISTDIPKTISLPATLDSHDVQVRISSTGEDGVDGETAAPSVLRIALGYHETKSVARS